MPLLGIIIALAGGQSLGAILAGLSVAQWVQIAELLLQAEPQILQAFVALAPELKAVGDKIAQGITDPQHLGTTAYSQYDHLGMGM